MEDLRCGAGGQAEDQSHRRGSAHRHTKMEKRGQMWELSKRWSQHDLVTSRHGEGRGKPMEASRDT